MDIDNSAPHAREIHLISKIARKLNETALRESNDGRILLPAAATHAGTLLAAAEDSDGTDHYEQFIVMLRHARDKALAQIAEIKAQRTEENSGGATSG